MYSYSQKEINELKLQYSYFNEMWQLLKYYQHPQGNEWAELIDKANKILSKYTKEKNEDEKKFFKDFVFLVLDEIERVNKESS